MCFCLQTVELPESSSPFTFKFIQKSSLQVLTTVFLLKFFLKFLQILSPDLILLFQYTEQKFCIIGAKLCHVFQKIFSDLKHVDITMIFKYQGKQSLLYHSCRFKKKVVLGLYVHSFFFDENVGGPRYKKKIGTVRKPECLLYSHTSDFIF